MWDFNRTPTTTQHSQASYTSLDSGFTLYKIQLTTCKRCCQAPDWDSCCSANYRITVAAGKLCLDTCTSNMLHLFWSGIALCVQQHILPCAVSKLDHVLHKDPHSLIFPEFVCKLDVHATSWGTNKAVVLQCCSHVCKGNKLTPDRYLRSHQYKVKQHNDRFVCLGNTLPHQTVVLCYAHYKSMHGMSWAHLFQ